MPTPNFVLLYVNSVADAAAFHAARLGRAPVEQSPNFAMFALDGGLMLGLWARHDVQPPPDRIAGELGTQLADAAAVDALHAEWAAQGVTILQPPTDMDFGRTFCAADPDGHRLRVFAPPAG